MKILIVRVSSLGDVLHNLAMVSDLRLRFPNARIDWVVEEGFVDLVRLHPGVNRIIPFALRRWRKSLLSAATRAEIGAFLRELRTEAYDWAFDTQGLFKTGLVLGAARLAPQGRKVGLANATEGSGYEAISRIFHDVSIDVPRRCHAVERGRLVASHAMGYPLEERPDFGLRVPALPPQTWRPVGDYVTFFHGTAGPAKKWSTEGWQRLADRLAEIDLPVLLPWGSQGELDAAEEIARGRSNCTVLPRLSLIQAIELARGARLAVGVDTGLTHVAAAYARPTIELYCASPRWKTEGNWSSAIVNLGDQGCAPTLEEVWQVAQRLLSMESTTR